MNEEERDLEEELKEEKERYERQNQEAYDEVTKGNEELRKKQEKEKKGLLDEGSAFRTTAAIGTEVGLNTLLDLFSFIPPAQVAGGSAINYLAQRIRGGKFSKGEFIASGLASLIPGGAQGKALARTAKGVGKGALSGAIETTGMTTVDEGRLPTLEELTIGAGTGGAFGGAFTTAANTKQIQELAEAIRTGGVRLSDEFMGPFRVALRGDLIGAVADGTGTSGSTQTFQLVTQFPWEYNPTAVSRPKANYGQTIPITNRRVPRGKTGRMITRRLNQFTKVEELDLSNGFTPTKQHANFREYIEDLIEADKIPAQNIAPTLFKAKVYKKTPDLELYEDYLSGYFNTYDTLEGATKVTLGPSAKTGKTQYFFPADDIPEVDRIMKIFKLNPEAFRNATAQAGVINNKQFLQEITKYTDLDDFLAQQFKFQGHHLAIIDDSFALVKGLNAKDTITMRNYMKSIDMPLGNDPENIKFIPQQLHQKFMHGKIWREYGPLWTGTNNRARLKQAELSKLPVEDRFKFADELKEALEVTNVVADRAINNYIISKGTNVPPTKKQWDDYMGELITDDLLDLPPVGTANEPGFDRLGGGQDLRPSTEIESDVFGQGQMQDDL